MAQSVIPNGTQAIEFRNRVVDNFMADTQGSIFVGTGNPSTNCSNSYIVETINPNNNSVAGLQATDIKLPIYTGAGNTGMVFTEAQYLNVGQAIQATKLGGGSYTDNGDSTHPVYFSGGLPIKITKVANAAYADTAGSAGSAGSAAWAEGAKKLGASSSSLTSCGSDVQPVYFDQGVPKLCTRYNQATVAYAGTAQALHPVEAQLSFTADTTGYVDLPSNIGTGQLMLKFAVRRSPQSQGTRDIVNGEVLIYNDPEDYFLAVGECPWSTEASDPPRVFVRFSLESNRLRWRVVVQNDSGGAIWRLIDLKVVLLWKTVVSN